MSIQAIKEFVKEYKNQDNRGTAFPYVYQLQEKAFTIVPDTHCYDEVRYYSPDHEEDISEKEFIHRFGEIDEVDFEENASYSFPDDLESYCRQEEFDKIHIRYYWKTVNTFFTRKGLEDHLAINHWNYGDTRTYVEYLKRNSEMELILKTLFELVGEELCSN